MATTKKVRAMRAILRSLQRSISANRVSGSKVGIFPPCKRAERDVYFKYEFTTNFLSCYHPFC